METTNQISAIDVKKELYKSKVKAKEVEEGSEFGMMVETKIDIASGDVLESFIMVNK